MRILMLSRDAAGLDPRSSTAARWRLLRDAGVELVVVVAGKQKSAWREAGVSVVGTGGGHVGRLVHLYRMAKSFVGTCDLITAQDPFELGLAAAALAWYAKKPFELQDHGGFFDGKPADEPFWAMRSALANDLVKRADAVRTVSLMSEARLRPDLGERAYWLPIACDEAFAGITRTPVPGMVVTVSRLVTVKRIDLLVTAFTELARRVPSAQLVIVGDGPERAKLEALAAELGISKVTTFAGAGNPAPWLAKASLFVSLSQHEGWGIASVEAALAGVPVLMTDTGCARWLEKHRRGVVLEDVREAASVMEKMLLAPMPTGQPLPTLSFRQTAEAQVKRWQAVVTRRIP